MSPSQMLNDVEPVHFSKNSKVQPQIEDMTVNVNKSKYEKLISFSLTKVEY